MVSSMFYNVGNLQNVCQCDSPVWLVTQEQHYCISSAFPFQKTLGILQRIVKWDSSLYLWNDGNAKMGKIFMNMMGCSHSWKNWVQLCPSVESSLPASALPGRVLLGFPWLSFTSCNTCCSPQNLPYLDLGKLLITSLFKHIFSSPVLSPPNKRKH